MDLCHYVYLHLFTSHSSSPDIVLAEFLDNACKSLCYFFLFFLLIPVNVTYNGEGSWKAKRVYNPRTPDFELRVSKHVLFSITGAPQT